MRKLERAIQEILASGGTIERESLADLADAYKRKELNKRALEALKLCAEKYAETYLQAYFEVVPWDQGVMFEAETFSRIYRFVEEKTGGFRMVDTQIITSVLQEKPCSILIFRLILGYSLDEIELILQKVAGVSFGKDKLREIEQRCENATASLIRQWSERAIPVLATFFFKVAHGHTFAKLEDIPEANFMRRAKVLRLDPARGWEGVSEMASGGVAFVDLLYQRYVGGTVRQALDMGSALKADILEEPIRLLLTGKRIPFYQTRPRERIQGWEQAPDFLIPSRETPEVVIEAKVAEDGGTARDKASRIERLARMAKAKDAVCIAVIDGKGFRRINDVLVPILVNCQGRVFSYSNLRDILTLPEIARWMGRASA